MHKAYVHIVTALYFLVLAVFTSNVLYLRSIDLYIAAAVLFIAAWMMHVLVEDADEWFGRWLDQYFNDNTYERFGWFKADDVTQWYFDDCAAYAESYYRLRECRRAARSLNPFKRDLANSMLNACEAHLSTRTRLLSI